MDYLLKASAVLLIFYLCYQLFLQRETFFQANRWFLLSGLVFASCIPLVVIPNYVEYTATNISGFTFATDTTVPIAVNNVAIETEPFDYTQLIIWTYLIGILFFFGKLAIEFLSLRKILKTSQIRFSSSYKLLETKAQVAPFSFFNRIVYNPSLFKDDELAHVINHEKVHTKELHSIDTIVAQISCILFWFNPIIWLYKKALQQNLEFIADQKAQYISECDISYQTVLLKASVKNHQLAFTNNFYTSLIKKRIVMLHKSKSNKINQLKFCLVLPLLALFMMSFNTETIYVEVPSEEKTEAEYLIPQTGDIEIVITKDTTDEQLKKLKERLEDKGITFTYSNLKRNKEGQITSIKTDFKSAERSSNYNINGDDGIKAFRFKSTKDSFNIGSLDKGQNVFVYETKDGEVKAQSTGSSNVYVFESDEEDGQKKTSKVRIKTSSGDEPIILEQKAGQNFWVKENGKKISINASENGKRNIFISESDDPLFIIDGKVVEKADFEDVDSEQIQSINVLKGTTAVQSYGGKAKNGVVVMTKKGGGNKFVVRGAGKNNTIGTYEFIQSDGEQPLIIVDGKAITTGTISDINPNAINSIDVIKDQRAVKVYGEKGKNGVIVVNTKSPKVVTGYRTGAVVKGHISPVIVETKGSYAYVVGDDYSTAEFIISKNSSDAFLKQQKSELKKHGIDAKFSKVRRNKAGEITSIKITLNDKKGSKSTSSWKEKDQAIPDIVMGKSQGENLFIRAIGN
ncbi:M56 family metallopeptidase [Psychroserpens luteolus]|uniref:M56 family metallopeptidase n=1 Tax=Psychroserpens luteolus TaxID=2855840 RepID=UPI001E3E85A7|nr:M56 family metallopeptidase [Psychroserpens luteolus]MCD2260396.1 TonB-dependent receptor plug domain-containing protein [Psychroserpens luteolus]